MAKYINRVDALKVCREYSSHCFNTNDARGQDIADRIEIDIVELPTADVEEVKHGEWLEHEEMFYDGEFHSEYPMKGYKCSLCGRILWNKEPYCNCGAKMDGGAVAAQIWMVRESKK